MSVDFSQIGVEAGLVSLVVTFAGKFLFVTKSELALSVADQKAALDKHAEEDRKERTAEYRRLFDKMDAMVAHIGELRVEVAKIASENRYSRHRASDPDPT